MVVDYILVVPHVLADMQSYPEAAPLNRMAGIGGLEVAVLIEYVVGRKQHLDGPACHVSILQKNGRVEEALTDRVGVSDRSTHDHAELRGNLFGNRSGNGVDGSRGLVDKQGVVEEVHRWVANDRHLREDHEIGAAFDRPPAIVQNSRDVASNVADDRIYLG